MSIDSLSTSGAIQWMLPCATRLSPRASCSFDWVNPKSLTYACMCAFVRACVRKCVRVRVCVRAVSQEERKECD